MIVKTVREYALLSIEDGTKDTIDHAKISESAFEYLCNLAATFKRNGATLLLIEGRKRLKLDSYVGVIETPCGTCIEILPKHTPLLEENPEETAREQLIKMLEKSLHLKARLTGSANLNAHNLPLHEWVMQQFLIHCRLLIQKGLHSDYLRIEEDQPFLRGQLDMIKQMRQPIGRSHIFPIRHDVLSFDRAENRLLKSAIENICKLTSNPQNWREAQELRLMTNGIPISTHIVRDFGQWRNTRMTTHYQSIRPWCELVLGQFMPAFMGEKRGFSMLFPMEKLFESYVAACLKTQLPLGAKLITQASSKYLCHHLHDDGTAEPFMQLKPDLLIQQAGYSIILDTKWKLLGENNSPSKAISATDCYQMFAYSHAYLQHIGRVVLIYPKHARFESPLHFRFNELNEVDVSFFPFDLDNNGIDMVKTLLSAPIN